MRFLIIALVLCTTTLIAAPPPRETETGKLKRLWGEPLDPLNDCKIGLNGNQLKISLPATTHRFTPYSGKSEAPRIRQELTGDFSIQVKVISVTAPVFTEDDGTVMSAGGIFIGPNDDTFMTLSRYNSQGGNGGAKPQILFQHRLPESTGSNLSGIDEEQLAKPIYLKLIKEGKKVSGYTSADGKKWKPSGQEEYDWPEKVYVGVFASHSSPKEVEAMFDEWDVKAIKKP